ncbi:MAG: 4-hydroxy-tetrahydrodipicolinate synthase [Clostridia bacterium]|nr:4-hydroxy-tetrahydrodipicolinate synthase [Clostridia bacterium]
MKNTVFTGVATAIVTPMTKDGSVDFEQFGKLIEWQIAEGINAIVACGTTGESSTLTDEEHKAVIKYAVDKVNGRVPVIAGTGSNDTDYAIDLTKYACEAGADAMLVVTPYYNKATQNGLITMFTAIADASTKPIILYNVPSRTGVNIAPATVKALSKHPNICGIKEASGNISQIAEIAALVGDDMDLYSGNDDQIVPLMSLGGKGVISVLSNVLPKKTVEICDSFFAGDIKRSCALQLELLPLVNALFSEVNPIPVKAATAAMGYGENYLRLPLTPMEDAHKKVLFDEMKKQGIEIKEI